ncbi:PREDICTED: alanine--glyoxylate aminotransferase 2 homolog 1, mitochondrial-like [Acropora digitifera]|uniref:alanine--glyoxylate aminotransferase 2 homolog 1, mitochondrial-like n=1 Tax=Acropora digitifera TaxID=70779 RepID=UPI00077AE218|nr:PREDICTED: alanine--glyoxylate aminotransferase 2 homolog 1, mitochondrial-like [Acropora digitifera]
MDPGLEMPKCDFEPEPYQGISFEHAKEVRKNFLNPALFTYYKNPVFISKGHMQWLWDNEGKRYLDLFAGIVTVSVGHCHPHVTEAAKKQLDTLWHTTNIYYHPTIHEFAELMVSKMPGNLKVCYFVNSGTEANDMAIMMARAHTGSYDMLSLRNGYHGTSPGTLGVLAHSTWKLNVPVNFGFFQTINPDVYQGPWGGANCRNSIAQTDRPCDCSPGKYCCWENWEHSCSHACISRHNSTCDRLYELKTYYNYYYYYYYCYCYYCYYRYYYNCCFVQGVGGAVHLPKGFLKAAYELIRERGGVCIADEVQTGFGRLGTHYWGFETEGVTPDIVTMAKGIGNGFPMAAVVTTPEIAKSFAQAVHFNTFGGNPIASAVGKAVLEAIDQDGTQENANVVGNYFLEKLLQVKSEFPDVVGDVRGRGLMIGVELVTDKESKTPLPAERFVPIWEDIKDMGVLIGKGGLYGNVFRIKPPMCITKEDVDFGIEVMRTALTRYTLNE